MNPPQPSPDLPGPPGGDLAFLRSPEKWPRSDARIYADAYDKDGNIVRLTSGHAGLDGRTCCLKKPSTNPKSRWPDVARIRFDNGVYTFKPDNAEERIGGDELVQALVAEGWIVD